MTRPSDLLRTNPVAVVDPSTSAKTGTRGFAGMDLEIARVFDPEGLFTPEYEPSKQVDIPDELMGKQPSSSPNGTTYEDILAMMDILGIVHTSWTIDTGKKLRAVRIEKKGGRYIDYRVNEASKEEFRNMSMSVRSLARCGAVSVWLWAIGTLIEDDAKAKALVALPPAALHDSTDPFPINQSPDLPTVGVTLGSNGRRLGPFPSGRGLNHDLVRDQCEADPES